VALPHLIEVRALRAAVKTAFAPPAAVAVRPVLTAAFWQGSHETSIAIMADPPSRSGLATLLSWPRIATVKTRFSAVEDLIREVDAKAAEKPYIPVLLVTFIEFVTRSEVDPGLLNRIFIERIASTVTDRLPPRRSPLVAVESTRVLLERLQATRAI
jgi:hypothetical protein